MVQVQAIMTPWSPVGDFMLMWLEMLPVTVLVAWLTGRLLGVRRRSLLMAFVAGSAGSLAGCTLAAPDAVGTMLLLAIVFTMAATVGLQLLAGPQQTSTIRALPGGVPHPLRWLVERDLAILLHLAGRIQARTTWVAAYVPFTRKPVNIYSDGIRSIIAAMSRHGVERVVVVSSTATEPHHHAGGGFLLYRVLLQLVIATFGKTSISDMRWMEALLRDSDLRWTIMRPSKLFDAPGVSSYELHEGQAPGIFTSRADLAASLLKQATDDRFVRKAVEVTTSQGVPTLLQLFRR
jgi:hypothetical protein